MPSLLLCCGSSSRLTLDWQHEGIRLALVDMIRRAGDPTSRVEKVEHDEADGFKADVRSSQQRICLANRYKVVMHDSNGALLKLKPSSTDKLDVRYICYGGGSLAHLWLCCG